MENKEPNAIQQQMNHLEWSRKNLLNTAITGMKREITYDFIQYALTGLYCQNDEDGSFDPVDVDSHLAFELSQYFDKNKRTQSSTNATGAADMLAAIKAKK